MVWFTVLILVLLSIFLLHLTSQLDNAAFNGRHINQQKRFSDSVLSTFAAICQMDPSLQSSVTSTRIIMVQNNIILHYGVFFAFYFHIEQNQHHQAALNLWHFNFVFSFSSFWHSRSYTRLTQQILFHCSNHHRRASEHSRICIDRNWNYMPKTFRICDFIYLRLKRHWGRKFTTRKLSRQAKKIILLKLKTVWTRFERVCMLS